VWDDRYLTNTDFAFIYPFFTNDEVNRLEQKFLEQIQYARISPCRYNVTVKASLYARYYFELRALCKDKTKESPFLPLNTDEARALEIRSHQYQDSLFEVIRPREKLSHTVGSPSTIAKEKPHCGFAIIN
jgi:hypothetical protein